MALTEGPRYTRLMEPEDVREVPSAPSGFLLNPIRIQHRSKIFDNCLMVFSSPPRTRSNKSLASSGAQINLLLVGLSRINCFLSKLRPFNLVLLHGNDFFFSLRISSR
jgi:hypothetical protein